MMTSVELGMYLPSARTGTATLERARIAEEIGCHTVWCPDLIDPGVIECMTLASAVAATTERIGIGLGVVNLMLRSPQLLLRSLASLDQLSGGRLQIGLGLGVDFCFAEYGLEAAPYRQRVRQLEETLRAMRPHFEGGPVSFGGEFICLADADTRPLPVQQPCPPVLIGGGSTAMLRLAASYADRWDVGSWRAFRRHDQEPKLEVIKRKREELDEICHQIGRDPADIKTLADLWFTMAAEPAEARRAADKASSWSTLYELHGGTPEDILRVLSSYAEAGVDHIILSFLNFNRGDTPRLFQSQVMPALLAT